MTINTRENRARRDEFFEKLSALIPEFPELTTADDVCDDCQSDGFDPDAPVVVSNIVIGVTIRNIDDFEQLFWTTPYGQSYFTTKGIVAEIASML